MLAKKYFEHGLDLLKQVQETQLDKINQAAEVITQAIADGDSSACVPDLSSDRGSFRQRRKFIDSLRSRSRATSMQNRAHGLASRRASVIGTPVSSQIP